VDLPISKESWFAANINPLLDEKKPKSEKVWILSTLFLSTINFLEKENTRRLMELQQNLLEKSKEEVMQLQEKSKEEVKQLQEKGKEEVKQLQEKSKEEVKQLQEKSKEELLQSEKGRNKDVSVKELEIKELEFALKDLKVDKKQLHEDVLRARGKCNLRGAVEYCRAIIKKQLQKKQAADLLQEKFDDTLKRLQSDADFMLILKDCCERLKCRETDVFLCLGNIYHNLSKEHHGVDGEIGIYAKDWAMGERIAFISLFRFCDIPFQYYDEEGQRCAPPC